MNTCAFDAALLDLFLDGALSPAEAETVQAHLDSCPECQSYVDDILAMREYFPDDEEVELPENFAANIMAEVAKAPQSRPRKQPWGKLAVAAACLALIVVLQHVNLPFAMGGSKSAASIAPAAFLSDAAAVAESEESAVEAPAEASEPCFPVTADSSLEALREYGAGENLLSGEPDEAILVTATEAELGDLIVDEVPSDIYPGYTCYLLNSNEPIVAKLVERGLLQEVPDVDCIIRLEVLSE